MTEMTPNDRAFIKVSEELLRLRNDLEAFTKLATINGALNNWNKEQLREVRTDRLHSEAYTNFSQILYFLGDVDAQHKARESTASKITELEKLCEAYVRGKDIVMEKLGRDS